MPIVQYYAIKFNNKQETIKQTNLALNNIAFCDYFQVWQILYRQIET